MRLALDTNVLAYAEGVNAGERREIALDLVRRLPQAIVALPVQVLGELFNVLVRKAGWSRGDARDALLTWRDSYPVIETSPKVTLTAADLATHYRLGIWDALILSAASEAGCRLLLSEDMQDGFTWGGVTVANPFAASRHPLLEDALARVKCSP
ncbi:MAG: PIN domain-containing protein [Nitrococcus sp.]|nr:PIN domain-containing protein [Nitrococcus sp.]